MTMTPHFPFEASRLRDLSMSPLHKYYAHDIANLRSRLQESPEDVQHLRSMAIVGFVAEQYRTSYECYSKLEALLPECAEVYCGLARLFMHAGEESLAVMYYLKCIEAEADFYTAHEELGDYYLMLEQHTQAEYFYKAMLVDTEASGSGYFGLGLSYMAQTKHPAALECFEKALSKSYASDKCYHQMAIISARDQNWEDALIFFGQELVINPGSYDAHFGMGRVFEEMNEPAKALEHYTETLKLDPDLPEVYNNIAALYYNSQGNIDAALESLETALEKDPSDHVKSRIYINLYRMHHQQANYDKASYYYQLYVDAVALLED